MPGPAFASGKYPCGVCRKEIDVNSVYCCFCRCWMDKRCSGLKARLVDTDFKNNKHLPPPERNDRHKVRLGSVEYKIEYQFCYLGDILSSNCWGGGGVSSTTRV